MKKFERRNPSSKKDYFMITVGITFIGMLIFRLLLGRIIGDKGMACFGTAGEIYLVLGGTAAYGLSEAVSALVKYRIRREQYRNAQKVFKGALLLGGLIGAVLSILVFLSAQAVTGVLLNIPLAQLSVRMMAPSIFFFVMTGVFKGYFQGNGSRVPAMHSRILQMIFLFTGGLIGAKISSDYGVKVSALLQNDDYTNVYGAMGACVGILSASVICFLHALILFFIFRRSIQNQITKEFPKNQDSGPHILHMLLGTGAIYALFWLTFHGWVWLDEVLLLRFGNNTDELMVQWGAYYGKTLPIIGIIGSVICMICIPSIRRIMVLWEREEHRSAKERLGLLMHQCAVIVIPSAVFLAVLSENLLNTIFGGNNHQAVLLTQAGSIFLIFYVFSTLFMEMLQKQRQLSYVVGIGAGAFVLQAGIVILLVNSKLGVMSLIIGSIVFYLVTTVCGFLIISRRFQYNQEWIRTFAVTIVAAAVSGVIAMLLNKVFEPLTGALISMIICLVAAILSYLLLLVAARAFRSDEMDDMAGGRLLKKLSELLHIM